MFGKEEGSYCTVQGCGFRVQGLGSRTNNVGENKQTVYTEDSNGFYAGLQDLYSLGFSVQHTGFLSGFMLSLLICVADPESN